MKKMIYVLTAVTLMGCYGIGKKPYADALTKEEAYAAIIAFDKAWKGKNGPSVDSVLSKAYIYFTPSGNIFIRDSIVATAASEIYSLESVERIISDIQIDGNTAVVNTRWQGKGIYRDTPFDDDQRCSITLVKKDGLIQILSEHCTQIPHP